MSEQRGTSERLFVEQPDAAPPGTPTVSSTSHSVRPMFRSGGPTGPGKQRNIQSHPADPEATISWEKERDVTIIRFNAAEIKETVYTAQASKELKHFAIRNGGKVLLSLDNVQFLSSVGIAALVAFDRGLRLVGGQLKICGVRPTIAAVLAAAGLAEVFDIHNSEVDALRAFQLTER